MIDAILRLSVDRRHITLALVAVVVALGLWGYERLPIDAVPDITNVQVQINSEAPGYPPLETEQRITFPVETALTGLPGLAYTRSISRYGLSQVTVVFEDGTDLYFARQLVGERLASIRAALPMGIEPRMGPIATGLGEIFMYTLSAADGARAADGSPIDATELRTLQDWVVKPRLAQVPGVVEVNTIGGYDKQFHVTPDPRRLLAHGVTIQSLSAALRASNQNRGAGYVDINGEQLLVRSEGQLADVSDIENVVIAQRHGSPLRVSDVATVAIGRELRSGAATRAGRETVLGTAMMLVGANSRRVARDTAAALQEITTSLPEGVLLEAVYDRTTLVDRTIETVRRNLLEGALLVVAVLFALLGNLRAALITAAVIPLSMLLTLFGMAQAGVSANLMSLGALDFGLIVDGTVIIVENAVRRLAEAHRARGRPLALDERLEVSRAAASEVIRPSLFGIAIITAVYLPVFALTGVEGRMFHPMAATVVMALIAAMLLSVTVVPAAVAVFLRGPVSEGENPVLAVITRAYRRALRGAIRHGAFVLSGVTLLLAYCGWLATTLGSEFVPQLDEGDIAIQAIRIPGTSLSESLRMQTILETRLAAFPEVRDVFARTGTAEVATDPMPPNISDMYVMLEASEAWPAPRRSKAELIEAIGESLEDLPGSKFEFTQPIEMRFNELISGVRADVAVKVFGDDLDVLRSSADAVNEVLARIDGASDVRVEQVDGLPLLTIRPDRPRLARYGLTVEQLQAFVATSIGGEPVGLVYEGDRRFEIVVRLPEAIRQDLRRLDELPIPLSDAGDFVPLGEVARLELEPAPNQIGRENGKRRVIVTANVRGRDLGSFVREARREVASLVALPAGYWIDWGGTFEQLQSASRRLSIIVPATLVLILALLVIALGSARDALLIFTGVPLALTGGVLALWFRDIPLSISAGIGFIALSGIAVLNGLVMLTFIRERWARERDPVRAVVEGAALRLRPVLMTALVASLGFVPMAVNTGTGAEVQRPLATVVIGGIVSSTALTLFVLPILFRLTRRVRREIDPATNRADTP